MAAESEAQSLRESFGVRPAYISWIVRGFSYLPYFVPGYKKCTLLLQNRRHAEVLKKTPSSAKYVTRVRPPSVPGVHVPGLDLGQVTRTWQISGKCVTKTYHKAIAHTEDALLISKLPFYVYFIFSNFLYVR